MEMLNGPSYRCNPESALHMGYDLSECNILTLAPVVLLMILFNRSGFITVIMAGCYR